MAGREENTAATHVAVLESHRLIRQVLCIWLTGQRNVKFAGSASSTHAINQICIRGNVNTVLVGVDTDTKVIIKGIRALASRFENVRFVAITEQSDIDQDLLLNSGFHAVVPTSGGTDSLLRVLNAGAVVKNTSLPEPVTDPTDIGPLTRRETEVLSLVGQGSTSYDISEQLGISRSTVANHKERIFTKLQANNQAHAVARAVNMGLISPGRANILLGTTHGAMKTDKKSIYVAEEDPRRAG